MSFETAATDLMTRARVALNTCRTVHTPDGHTTCFELDVSQGDDGERFTLTGTVETEWLLARACADVREATGRAVSVREVTVLEGRENRLTVDSSWVPVRARPDGGADQITQALFGDDLRTYECCGEWTRVRVADGFLGWVENDRLVEATPIETNAVVSERVERLDTPVVPGVECKVFGADDDHATVEFRTGDRSRVPCRALSRRETATHVNDVVSCARSFLGTPYEQGGKTDRGTDAAGLVWVAYRSIGVPLPRDPEQQRRAGVAVECGEQRPGDLLFAPGRAAVSIGGCEYVHASREVGEVVTNSLSPEADAYLPAFDEDGTTARRILEL